MMRQLTHWDTSLSIRGMLAALTVLMAAIIALAALGLVQADLAFALTGALFATTALAFPRLGLALVVMVAPIQGLWGLSRADMPLLLGTLMAAVNLRHVGLWLRLLRPRPWADLPPLLVVLAAFTLLFVIWSLTGLPAMEPAQTKSTLMGCAFVVLLLGAAIAVAHHCGGTHGNAMRLGLIGAVVLALALTLSVDVVAVYFPELSKRLALVPEWPGLRLAGLHANPNATAKYLLAGLAFAVAISWRLSQRSEPARTASTGFPKGALVVAVLIATISAIAIGATSSKSSFIAAVLAPMAAAVAFWPRSKRAFITATASAVAIAVLILGYNVVLATGLATWTARQHFAVEQITPPEPKKQPSDITESLRTQMRVARSHEMVIEAPPEDKPQDHSQIYRNIDGKIKYSESKCESLACTGQRDRLWSTGIAIWRDNWIFGIGPTLWPDEYLQRAKFPFDSPHNILIEMGAGFGLAGLALYGAFVVVMWRLWRTTFSQPGANPTQTIFNQGAVLFAIALMATEWVDPAKFFAINPHALWLWLLLAGTIQAHATTPATARRTAATAAAKPE